MKRMIICIMLVVAIGLTACRATTDEYSHLNKLLEFYFSAPEGEALSEASVDEYRRMFTDEGWSHFVSDGKKSLINFAWLIQNAGVTLEVDNIKTVQSKDSVTTLGVTYRKVTWGADVSVVQGDERLTYACAGAFFLTEEGLIHTFDFDTDQGLIDDCAKI